MKSVNEQFAEMQKKTMESLEPMQNMNSVAAEAFERIARKNYDLMGDLMEYAVTQVKLPSGDADVQQVYEQRVADTKAFAEKVNERAAEYVALASELGELATGNPTGATKPTAQNKPAQKAAKSKKPAKTPAKTPAAKKTAAKKRAAKA